MNTAFQSVPDADPPGTVIEPEEFRNAKLEFENEHLRQENARLGLQVRNLKQTVIALGDLNRYHASNTLGRHATEGEAILHFIEKGGADDFRNSHPAPG